MKYAACEEDLGRIRVDVAVSSGLATVRALGSEDLLRPGSVGVEYRIMAPARAVLDRMVTTNGAIRIEGFQGAVWATTLNSPIHVGRQKGSMELKTSNGLVTVTEGSGFRLRARTSKGRVTSEFSVEPGTTERRSRMEGTVGAGGPLVDLSTSNAAVRVICH